MSKVVTDDSNYSDIADAIRNKLNVSTGYKPSEMASAISNIETGITPTGTINITQNGITNISQYASANVSVPNSYTSGDEGKVVSSGALVAQTARLSTITENGMYDTTNHNSVTVNVSGGGGESIIFNINNPTSQDGNNGDTFVKYHLGVKTTVKATGGYNGGAKVTVEIDETEIFTATASDTYNLNYNVTQASVSTDIGTVTIQIIPPSNSSGELNITVTGPNNSVTSNPPKQGSNTSYGYGDYSNSFYLVGSSGDRIADAIFIKQSGTWKGVGDIV